MCACLSAEAGTQPLKAMGAWPLGSRFPGNERSAGRMSGKPNRARAMRAASNSAHRLEPGAWMDLGLREHRRLRPEALDDAAHEWPRAGRSDEHGRFSGPRRLLETLAHERDELGETRGLHGKVLVVALADNRFGKRLLPLGR